MVTTMIKKSQVQPLVGKYVYALKKDGTMVEGKLVRIKGYELVLAPKSKKSVHTKAFIAPLVLFDLLAIGTSPFAFGFPGFGFGPGFGPGFFW
jgi:hypothetical protein